MLSESSLPLFVSKTTANALRVTIQSFIGVTELLFLHKAIYVLTGKLNQDCLEVRIHVEVV